MRIAFSRRAAALAIAGAVVLPLVTGTPVAAGQPGLSSVNGEITYRDGAGTFIVGQDGGGARLLVDDQAYRERVAWAPDGSRFAYTRTNGELVTMRTDGSDELVLHAQGYTGPYHPAWRPSGEVIVYADGNRLRETPADTPEHGRDLFVADPALTVAEPAVAWDGTVLFTLQSADPVSSTIYRYRPGDREPVPVVERGHTPQLSPDGSRLVFYRDERLWVTGLDGAGELEVPTNPGVTPGWPSWSPDGASILYVDHLRAEATVQYVDLATGQSSTVLPFGYHHGPVSWQPVVRNDVVRVWGADHVETAIAASQYVYGDHGRPHPRHAGAVVLSRDDTYYDALVGSAFAIHEQAPLLVTNRSALDQRVEREIQRLLGPSGRVYLLGGELALAPEIANRLTTLGYTTDRIWGRTHYDTAVAINQRITPTPQTAIVTTGTNFYDALAAGAVVGPDPGTVIALTAGSQLPAATAAYLDGLDPIAQTTIVTAGGPGDRALRTALQNGQLPSWPAQVDIAGLVGQNEQDTAILIAEHFFTGPHIAAVATNRTWFDALTGGAMIGTLNGPLLITDRTALYPGVHDYLSPRSAGLYRTVMLGGTAALPSALVAPIGDAIGLPGQWDLVDFRPRATITR